MEEKITGDEEEQEEDEDLDDIEEDTEVIDDETDDNDDHANNQKSESGQTPSITSNGSQAMYSLQHPKPEAGEPSLEPGHRKLEGAEQTSEEAIMRDAQAPAPRFPTGLFPPLPFDPAILSGDGTGIKVGILFNFG